MISYWDKAETDPAELGHLAAAWTDLSDATGAPRRDEMYFRGAGVMLPAESIGFLET